MLQLLPKKLVKLVLPLSSTSGKYKFVGYEELEKGLQFGRLFVFPKYSTFANLEQLLKASLQILVRLPDKIKLTKEELP